MLDLEHPAVLTVNFTSIIDRLEFNTPMGWITKPSFNINMPYPLDFITVADKILETLKLVEAVPLANDAGYQDIANLTNDALKELIENWDSDEIKDILLDQNDLELSQLKLIFELDTNRTGALVAIELASREDLEEHTR